MKVQCLDCGFVKESAEHLSGKMVRCPRCSREFVVNANETDDFVVVNQSNHSLLQEVEDEEVVLGEIDSLTVTNRRIYGKIYEKRGSLRPIDAPLDSIKSFDVHYSVAAWFQWFWACVGIICFWLLAGMYFLAGGFIIIWDFS